jgi:hypothetical protein
MKNKLDEAILRTALNSSHPPGTTLASFILDIHGSTDQLHFCVIRDLRWQQLTAMLLPSNRAWDYSNPALPHVDLVFPDQIVHCIRATFRQFKIRHIIGVVAESKVPQGTLLSNVYPNQTKETFIN